MIRNARIGDTCRQSFVRDHDWFSNKTEEWGWALVLLDYTQFTDIALYVRMLQHQPKRPHKIRFKHIQVCPVQ